MAFRLFIAMLFVFALGTLLPKQGYCVPENIPLACRPISVDNSQPGLAQNMHVIQKRPPYRLVSGEPYSSLPLHVRFLKLLERPIPTSGKFSIFALALSFYYFLKTRKSRKPSLMVVAMLCIVNLGIVGVAYSDYVYRTDVFHFQFLKKNLWAPLDYV